MRSDVVHHLLSDFLESDARYEEAQAFWYALVRRASQSQPDQRDWRRTTPATFADGVTLWPKEGNPLIEVTSSQLRRSIQIIQSPPESDELELAAWVTPREYWDGKEERAWDELTLNLSLSQESATLAEELIRTWMNPDTTREGMEAVIRSRLTT